MTAQRRAVMRLAALACGLLAIGLLQAQVTTEADAHSACQARHSGQGEAYNRCLDELKQSLTRRRSDCVQALRAWAVASGEQAVFYRRCMEAASLDAFRAERQGQGADAGGAARLPVDIDFNSLRRWVGFDGASTLNISALHSAIWEGTVHNGVPSGRGTLTLRFEYLHQQDFRDSQRKSGEMVLVGALKGGFPNGPVELRSHPEMRLTASAPVVNVFTEGVNTGLPVSTACASSLPVVHAGADVTWLGSCQGSAPHRGLAVFSVRGVAYDIACYAGSGFAARNEVEGFANCEPYWRLLPKFCAFGDYRGQCQDGRPWGVGVLREIKRRATFNETGGAFGALAGAFDPGRRSYFIQRGQFKAGALSGYGYSGSMENCGMVGCSGDAIEQVGLFESGRFKASCTGWSDCLGKTSGAAYTEGLRASVTPAVSAKAAELRQRNQFESHLAAFQLTGEREDIARAARQASTPAQQAQLEAELLRVAGYEKAFGLEASVAAGQQQSVDVAEKDRLMGLFRSTSADIPLTLNWRLASRPGVVGLRHGSYTVKFSVGLRARMIRRACVGTACSDEPFSTIFSRDLAAVLSRNSPEARGSFDVRTTSSDASVVLGIAMLSNLVDIEPFFEIESVEPQ